MIKFDSFKLSMVSSLIFLLLGVGLFWELKSTTDLLDFNMVQGCDMLNIFNTAGYYAHHGSYSRPPSYSSRSIYPDIISVFLRLDYRYEIICLFHCLLLGAIGFMMASITSRLFHNQSVSLVSLGLFVLYGPIWMYSMIILREFFSVFCSVLIIFSFYRLAQKFSIVNVILFGFSNILAVLIRINFIPVFLVSVIFFLILFIRSKISARKKIVLVTIFALTLIVLSIPFFLRASHYKQTVFSVLMKIENPRNFLTRAWSETHDFEGDTFLYDDPSGRKQTLLRGTVRDIVVGHLPDIRNWFGAYEIPDNVDFYQFRSFSWILRLMRLDFAMLGALALIGFIELAYKRRMRIVLFFMTICFILFSLSFILTIPSSRYRLAAVPFIIPICGYAVVSLVDRFRKKKVYSASVLILIGIGFYLLFGDYKKIQERSNNSWFAYRYGELLLAKGKKTEAEREFTRAVFNSYRPTAPAYIQLAYLYFKQARFEEARNLIFRLKEQVPDDVDGSYILAIAYHQEKRYRESLHWFKRYYEECPSSMKPQIESIIRQLETDSTDNKLE